MLCMYICVSLNIEILHSYALCTPPMHITAENSSDNLTVLSSRGSVVVCWRHDSLDGLRGVMQTPRDSVIRPLPATVFSRYFKAAEFIAFFIVS